MIGDDIAAVLPELQAEASSALTDHGTLNRATKVFDRAANAETVVLTPYYTGQLRARSVSSVVSSEQGGVIATAQPIECRAPWDVAEIEPGHVMVLDQSGDPRLIGRELTVRSVRSSSHGAWRRFICVDEQG